MKNIFVVEHIKPASDTEYRGPFKNRVRKFTDFEKDKGFILFPDETPALVKSDKISMREMFEGKILPDCIMRESGAIKVIRKFSGKLRPLNFPDRLIDLSDSLPAARPATKNVEENAARCKNSQEMCSNDQNI